jgi:hypothetical protein
VLRTPRPDVKLSYSAPSLFDGSWNVLSRAVAVDQGLERVYLPLNVSAAPMLQNDSSSLVLGSSIWDPIFALRDIQAPPNITGRARYPFDPGFGYAYEAGEVIRFKSSGIAAVRLLLLEGKVQLTCGTGDQQQRQQLVIQPREPNPHWYAIRCDGMARLVFSDRTFVQALATTTKDDLRRRVDVLNVAMAHPNSAYVLEGTGFAPDFMSYSPNPDHITGATLPEDPIVLPSGSYRISLHCLALCPGATIELLPQGIGSPADSIGLPLGDSTHSASRIRVALSNASVTTVSIPGGLYQVRLINVMASNLESLALQRLPLDDVGSAYASPLSQGAPNLMGPAVLVEINEGPGPWSVSTPGASTLETIPADIIGSAYFAAHKRSVVSFEILTSLETIGSVISVATIGVITLLLLLASMSPGARASLGSYLTSRMPIRKPARRHS